MYKLAENHLYKDGILRYQDECGNTAFYKRKEEGFVLKFRFADKRATAEPLHVDITKTDQEGADLKMHYNPPLINKNDIPPTVKAGIDSGIPLLQRLYQMTLLLRMCGNPNLKRSPDGNEYAKKILLMLSEFEELEEMFQVLRIRKEDLA